MEKGQKSSNSEKDYLLRRTFVSAFFVHWSEIAVTDGLKPQSTV
jgi:hypothetical protein